MKSKACDLSSYSFSSDDQVLIDTNIWLFLFPAPCDSEDKRSQKYSDDLHRLQKAEACLVLDPMVLSEYLNTYMKIE